MRFAHPLLPMLVFVAAAACGSNAVNSIPGDDSAPLSEFKAPTPATTCGSQGGEVGCPEGGAGGAPASSTPVDAGASSSDAAPSLSPTPTADAAPSVCVPPDVFGTSTWNDHFDIDAVVATQKVVQVHGEACLDCHANPTAPEIPHFDFGGRVFDANGHPAAGVEVRVTSSQSGQPISAYSNPDGYFWWPPPPGGDDGYDDSVAQHDVATFPSNVGARTAQGAAVAMCAQATGNCGSCHKDATMPIKTK